MGSRSGDVDPTVLSHIGNISFKGCVREKQKGVQTDPELNSVLNATIYTYICCARRNFLTILELEKPCGKIIFYLFSPSAQQIEVKLVSINAEFNSGLANTPFYFLQRLPLKTLINYCK